jgi:uncharacterized repeat protein (TIGR03809 family)
MTHRTDVARGRDIVARWCGLAERRLEHLTELFDSGRWRRYHSELAFLENIQEAKAAVETWRDLLSREASLDNAGVDLSWLGRSGSVTPRDGWRDRIAQLPPQPVEISIAPPLQAASTPAEAGETVPHEVLATAETPAPDHATMMTIDLARIQERYPLLRNAL